MLTLPVEVEDNEDDDVVMLQFPPQCPPPLPPPPPPPEVRNEERILNGRFSVKSALRLLFALALFYVVFSQLAAHNSQNHKIWNNRTPEIRKRNCIENHISSRVFKCNTSFYVSAFDKF